MAGSPLQDDGAPSDGAPSEIEVTRILRALDDDAHAPDALLPLVYENLRAIAQRRMANERPGHTLAATALVHEAYVRLIGTASTTYRDRGHFFAAAAEAMRRILIDHARRKGSVKRGGDRQAVPLSIIDLADDPDLDLVMALDDAVTTLEREDPRAATVVKLRFFAGLEVAETADAMGVSERTVMREWAFARARLYQLMGGEDDAEEPTP